MDSSVAAIGDVQSVLLSMQKNLECPICLELIKEPVSTKCDHIFCRFCMLKLLSKKRKGLAQCPLCKTEVTKRSLQENPRFKQLIEGLLETIHAFELDTGIKFLNSQDFSQKPVETNSTELLWKEGSIIHSKGYRNRQKRVKEKEQENPTLLLSTSLFLCMQTLRCLTAYKSCVFSGECGFSEEDDKDTWNSPDDFKAAQVNLADDHLKESHGISASNSQADQCDRTANASSLLNKDTSLFCSAEEMDAGETQFSSKNKEFGLAHSSENQMDKSKKTDNEVQHTGAVETSQPESNSRHERESALENQLRPKTLHSNPLTQVSGKRLKRSIQKVNEWFSKSNEMLSSSSSQDVLGGAANSEDGDSYLSDGDSCISEKTDLMLNCMEVVVGHENNRSLSKSTVHNIEDKIFGKTYKREKKSNPSIHMREIPQSPKVKDVNTDVKFSSNSRTNKFKRKRKTASDLQPEDFIKRREEKDLNKLCEEPNQCPVGKNGGKKKDDEGPTVVNGESMGVKKGDNPSAELLLREGESKLKNDPEKGTCSSTARDPAQNTCAQKSTNKIRSSLPKRSRRSAKPMCALQLVVDRTSNCPDQTELEIDSYPSSEEPRKVDSEQRRIRRSRRLQLLTEKVIKETTRRDEPNERARKHASEREDSSSGLQRNVLVHVPDCKDPEEQQDVLNHGTPLSDTNLKGSDLEAGKTHPNPENFSDSIQIGKGHLYVEMPMEDLNARSVVPDTDSQDSENPGSHSLLQPHSMEQAVCPVSENLSENNQCAAVEAKKHELCACLPKDSRDYAENDKERIENQKSHEANIISGLNTETEDSELDIQYLRNMFRHSKRLSFTLHPSSVKESVTENAVSETLRKSSASCVEYRHHNRNLKNEPPRVQKPVGLDEICEREEPKTCESAKSISGHSPGTHFSNDNVKNISQVPEQVQLLSPTRTATAKVKTRSRLQKRRQPNEKTRSPEMMIESQLNLSLNKSNKSLSDQSNLEEQIFQRTESSPANETGFGSGSNQGVKGEVAENKGPVLNIQPQPMLVYPAVCQHSSAGFSCKVTEKNGSEEEHKQENKNNQEQVTQFGSIGVPECLISEEPLEQPNEDINFPLLSETVDGLLCSADDIKENTSICEIDRKEISAVFVKAGENALLKELDSVSCSSESKSQSFVLEPKRLARKLQYSEEDSSEDEELPCFQALIFGKSANAPSHSAKQVTTVVGSSAASPAEIPVSLSSSSGNNKAVQKMPGVTLGDACVSPSQESECSVNLFSSQSNNSEDSTNKPQELKKPITLAPGSKEMTSFSGSKEASQDDNEDLKGSKTDLEDGYQGDENEEPNLGEASGYDSEASHPGDSSGLSSQSEILTTQQREAMQNNLKKLQQEMAILEAVLEQHGSQGSEFSPSPSELPHSTPEGTLTVSQMSLSRENAAEQEFGTKINSAAVFSSPCGSESRTPNSSPLKFYERLTNCQTAESTKTSAVSWNVVNGKPTQGCKQEKRAFSSAPALHTRAGKENAESPVVTCRRQMSIVASGLNQSELLLVQKFARKTQSTLSNQITEGTTHVIMKTDMELVCERTLKYFLGIAGRKWVVSYEWVVQSFKEGRILGEDSFEVRGDVINGRNHQGPKRARQSQTGKLFKDLEICCYGPFTDMRKGEGFWIKGMYCSILQKCNATVVTREWVLDSVACYECQKFGAYLVSQS
uniref:RING-type E3 ubiquitin transferase n=1 Tax=Pelusios castaneus TaxID=367368 RepID=A0A8C8RCQ3_9SAUR